MSNSTAPVAFWKKHERDVVFEALAIAERCSKGNAGDRKIGTVETGVHPKLNGGAEFHQVATQIPILEAMERKTTRPNQAARRAGALQKVIDFLNFYHNLFRLNFIKKFCDMRVFTELMR
ncbi:hypothetical protein H6F67_21020 [Microcoleus sp. FACHB-1515]|uniref:hypothetical protein n=1 Tax=Cyanophyceae TaxID=3028117 RepID=UPI00168638E6|nr:hypothetical protein [Microcoleus sp. FACHB-1515]MBD2092335.1 hypothetical protein [Microcoleus sp. FACHB-1515]